MEIQEKAKRKQSVPFALLINRGIALAIMAVGSVLLLALGHPQGLGIASLGLIRYCAINVSEGVKRRRCMVSFQYFVVPSDSPFLFHFMMACWTLLGIAAVIFSLVIFFKLA